MSGNATTLDGRTAIADIIDDANSFIKENTGIDPASIIKEAGNVNTKIEEITGVNLYQEGMKEILPDGSTVARQPAGGQVAQTAPKQSGVPAWAWYAGGGAALAALLVWKRKDIAKMMK